VGVNGGLANNANPCFGTELAWANGSTGTTAQPKASLYVNTANPGDVTPRVADWPTSGSSVKYGTCDGSNSAACAYIYGQDRATYDVGLVGASTYRYWLDVETTNSWSANQANNVADLEGMTDYFTSQGNAVGIYSTGYQWGQIVGSSVGTTSSLNGLSDWLAGGGTLSGATTLCGASPLTTGGSVSVTQYMSHRVDNDHSCI
jgi:hypothetical protein